MSLSAHSIQVADDIVSRGNKDGTFVLMKMDESDNFFKVTGVAAEVWRGLSEGLQLEEIVTSIQNEFDVPKGQLENDINDFLTALKSKELIY